VRIDSVCHHCGRPLRVIVTDALDVRAMSPGATPLLFMPDMNWRAFRGANIIHDY
jgi:hypothetical protein